MCVIVQQLFKTPVYTCVCAMCVCVSCVYVCHDAATLQDICMHVHKLTHMRCTCAQTDTHLYKVIGKKLPRGGVSLLCGFQIKNSEEEDPPLKITPKLISFEGGFSGGVLFLRVLDLETTQPPRGGGGSCDQ